MESPSSILAFLGGDFVFIGRFFLHTVYDKRLKNAQIAW